MNRKQEQQIVDYYSTTDKYVRSRTHSNAHQSVYTKKNDRYQWLVLEEKSQSIVEARQTDRQGKIVARDSYELSGNVPKCVDVERLCGGMNFHIAFTNDETDIICQFGERGKAETCDHLSAVLQQIKDGDTKRIVGDTLKKLGALSECVLLRTYLSVVLSDFQLETAIKESRKALSTAERRVKELDELIRKLYEGNATGKIPDKHFERLLAEYDGEQSVLEGRIEEIRGSVAEQEKKSVRTDKFMEVVRKYQGCGEITTPMLNEFIEKIVVHEADKSEGRLNRKQKVDIYFNFVGQIDLSEPSPQEEPTGKPTGKKKAKAS